MGKDPVRELTQDNMRLGIRIEALKNIIIERDEKILSLQDRIFKLEAENKKLLREKGQQGNLLESTLQTINNQREEVLEENRKWRNGN